MNKKTSMKLISMLVVISLLVIGTVAFAHNRTSRNGWSNMMGVSDQINGHMGGNMMSYGVVNNQEFNQFDLKPLEELKENVMKYLESFDGEFEIEDIFVYSDSDYYFSIIEEDTGRGAMELLVNPVTGYVYPEFGPNMMWNIKYGMHGSNGHGMMGSFLSNYSEKDEISLEDAIVNANRYLEKIDEELIAEKGGHAFYGYYTFHINNDEEIKGMMSVNAYTGEVWYHNWHGKVIEVISEGHK